MLCVCLQPDLQGLLPVVDGSFTQVQKNAFRWPDPLKQAVAVCNALTLINKKHVVGEVSEKKTFEAVEAQFLVSWHWGLSHSRTQNHILELTDSTHRLKLTESNSRNQLTDSTHRLNSQTQIYRLELTNFNSQTRTHRLNSQSQNITNLHCPRISSCLDDSTCQLLCIYIYIYI